MEKNLSLLLFLGLLPSTQAATLPVQKVEFVAKTNLSAVSVKGKNASNLSAEVEIQKNEISKFQTQLDVKNLETGLSLRDEHMREKIFKTADGQLPEIRFTLLSPFPLSGAETFANASLSMHGKDGTFKPLCKATQKDGEVSLECAGEVKLTDFGITPPSHMGVTVQDSVTLRVSTVGKMSP